MMQSIGILTALFIFKKVEVNYMIQRFVLRSTNYVYVYHSGGSELKYMRFMGMTESAYVSAKGTFKVLCFCSMYKDREETISEIKEDFSLDKSDRNVDANSVEESVACLDEFLKEIKPMLLEKFPEDKGYTVLFKNGELKRGLLYKGFIEPYMYKGYAEDGLTLDFDKTVKLIDTIDNESSLLTTTIPFLAKGKGMTPIQALSKMYNARRNNCILLKFIESADGTEAIFCVQGCILTYTALETVNHLLGYDDTEYVLKDYKGTVYYY